MKFSVQFVLALVVLQGLLHSTSADFSACAASSTGVVVAFNKCVQVFSTALSRTDAEASCVANGGHLATIRSDAENTAVTALLTGATLFDLNDIADEGIFRYRDGTLVYTKTTNVSSQYTNWRQDAITTEPNNNNGNGEEDCTTILHDGSHDGLWNDVPCQSTSSNDFNAYACEFIITNPKTETACTQEGGVVVGNKCIRVIDFGSSVSWYNAKFTCDVLGGATASLLSSDEQVNFNVNPAEFWIGLSFTGGNFTWDNSGADAYDPSTGTNFTFVNWGTNPTSPSNPSCAFVTTTGVWDVTECGGVAASPISHYACEWSISPVSPTCSLDYQPLQVIKKTLLESIAPTSVFQLAFTMDSNYKTNKISVNFPGPTPNSACSFDQTTPGLTFSTIGCTTYVTASFGAHSLSVSDALEGCFVKDATISTNYLYYTSNMTSVIYRDYDNPRSGVQELSVLGYTNVSVTILQRFLATLTNDSNNANTDDAFTVKLDESTLVDVDKVDYTNNQASRIVLTLKTSTAPGHYVTDITINSATTVFAQANPDLYLETTLVPCTASATSFCEQSFDVTVLVVSPTCTLNGDLVLDLTQDCIDATSCFTNSIPTTRNITIRLTTNDACGVLVKQIDYTSSLIVTTTSPIVTSKPVNFNLTVNFPTSLPGDISISIESFDVDSISSSNVVTRTTVLTTTADSFGNKITVTTPFDSTKKAQISFVPNSEIVDYSNTPPRVNVTAHVLITYTSTAGLKRQLMERRAISLQGFKRIDAVTASTSFVFTTGTAQTSTAGGSISTAGIAAMAAVGGVLLVVAAIVGTVVIRRRRAAASASSSNASLATATTTASPKEVEISELTVSA